MSELSGARTIPAPDGASVDEAVRVLREGGLVCYPTDTVYGIGARAGDEAAVGRLFAVKGRSLGKPLPLLLGDAAEAAGVAEATLLAETLAARFWPGALTIVVRKLPSYRSLALGGEETVALRLPDHDLVREIVRRLGEPITGTSANRSGRAAPVSASEVGSQIGDMVELIIDGGRCRGRAESTVIDITENKPRILRQGVVSRREIEEALGEAVCATERQPAG